MRHILLVLVFFACTATRPLNAQDQEPWEPGDYTINRPPSSASNTPANQPASWLFPVAKLNETLPYWIQFGGEYRDRFEGPQGIGYAGVNDYYLLSRLRVHVDVQPLWWLRFHAELQDARIFWNHHIPSGNPYQDTFTLWEGYAQVGSSTEGWVDVLGGRQVLRFGDERVIGPSDWLNVGRTFNVARVDIHQPGWVVNIFASSVVPGDNAYLHNAYPGENLYGAYGSLTNLVPRATFEPYLLWSVAPSNPALPQTLGRGNLNEFTIGLHWTGELPKNFDYDTELDGQTGSLGPSSIAARAFYVSVGKTFTKVAGQPRIFGEWNYASGTKNPAGRKWNTFDQLFPSNHDKYGFEDQVGRRNLIQFRVGVEEEGSQRWRFKQQFEGYWLDTTDDNFYASSGAIAVLAHPGASRHIGNELDLVAEYQFNKGLNLGFGYGVLFAGQFLRTTTQGHDYQYPFAYVEYNFSKSGFHFPIHSNAPHQP